MDTYEQTRDGIVSSNTAPEYSPLQTVFLLYACGHIETEILEQNYINAFCTEVGDRIYSSAASLARPCSPCANKQDLEKARELLERYKDVEMLRKLKKHGTREELLQYIQALEMIPVRAANRMFTDGGFMYSTATVSDLKISIE